MIGRCDSCLKFPRVLIIQTNFGVKRNMCGKCCEAANEVERRMTLSPSERYTLNIPKIGQHRYFAVPELSKPTPEKSDSRSMGQKVRDAFWEFEE